MTEDMAKLRRAIAVAICKCDNAVDPKTGRYHWCECEDERKDEYCGDMLQRADATIEVFSQPQWWRRIDASDR